MKDLDAIWAGMVKPRIPIHQYDKWVPYANLRWCQEILLSEIKDLQRRQYRTKSVTDYMETQLDILCLRIYKHLKSSEICTYYNYGRTTIKYRLGQIKEKLGITTL